MNAIDHDIAGQLAAELPHDVFIGVVRTFEVDLTRLVRQMLEAGQAADMEAFRRAAHGLAGAAGSIGAKRLERLARLAMSQSATPLAEQMAAVGEEARAALAGLAALAEAPPAAG